MKARVIIVSILLISIFGMAFSVGKISGLITTGAIENITCDCLEQNYEIDNNECQDQCDQEEINNSNELSS
jgi:hypothetical protein